MSATCAVCIPLCIAAYECTFSSKDSLTIAASGPEARYQTRTSSQCDVTVPGNGTSIILRSTSRELSNNIIQEGLAFCRDPSGTVTNPGRQGR
jgi:hypothetical protein